MNPRRDGLGGESAAIASTNEAILDDFYASFEPMTELDGRELLVVDTDRPVDVKALRVRAPLRRAAAEP